ncbi:MAG: NBR1-Ig-like domain-containing protein [Chloroflexota bacterium]
MHKIKILLPAIAVTALILSACGGGSADATPTLSVDQIQTLAVFTFQAGLTQTALAQPTATPVPTNTPSPEATFALPTGGASIATNTSSVGAAACYDSAFAGDVTIPDKTSMTPGQSFTKTWRMLNNGTCAWEPGFIFNIVGGEAMGGVAVTLNQKVEPGRQIEISVPMVAPKDKTGELKGTWRLSDASGNFFGDAPWVIIVVGGTTATATGGTATSTSTPTPTPTTPTSP